MELQTGAGVGATVCGLGVIEGMGATSVTGPMLCPVALATAGLEAGGAPLNPDAMAEAATVFPCALFGASDLSTVFSTEFPFRTVPFGQYPEVP